MSVIRRLIPPLWLTYTMWMLLLIGIVVFVFACGDDDDSVEVDNPTWFVTTDPYGREWSCLTVSPSVGVGLFCARPPAP